MKFIDKITIGTPKKTATGFLVADVRAVRTGIQTYTGAELGKPELRTVNVYRPDTEVFNVDSLASFSGVTVTMDHPSEMVNADNWSKYSIGEVRDGVLRDGEFMRIPIVVRDAAAIATIEAGKNQLSAGYDAEIEWIDGVTDDGLTYQAVQRNIRGNHLSVVGSARGGEKLKIGDSKVTTKTMIVDGLMVEVTDAAEAAINKLNGVVALRDAAVVTANAEIKRLTDELSAKTGEIAVLNQKVTDSALTPEKLNEAVARRASLIDSAKKIIPTFDAGTKTDIEIKREVVKTRIGDGAAELNDAALDGAFGVVVADGQKSSIRDSFGTIAPSNVVNFADGAKREADAHAAMIAGLNQK